MAAAILPSADEGDAVGLLHGNHSPALDVEQQNSLAEFDSLTIIEVLDQDSRPTFVIDLDPDESITIGASRIAPIFCNAALRSHEKLADTIVGTDGTADPALYEEFSAWATGVTKFDDSKDVFPLSFLFNGMLWTGSTVRRRWRLISGNLLSATEDRPVTPLQPSKDSIINPKPAATEPAALVSVSTATIEKSAEQVKQSAAGTVTSSSDTGTTTSSKRLFLASPEKAVADWTSDVTTGYLTPHIAFARNFDWGATPLGPMSSWSAEFRQIVNLVMNNPHPASLFWGPELNMLYNEAYANEVAGNKHPGLMGTGFSGPFSELWDAVSPLFAECARTGISIRKEDDYLPIHRHGFLEETFYSWSWTPLYGGTRKILGFYNAPFETTQAVLHHRRTQTVSRVGTAVSRAKTLKQFWKLILESLEENHFDVPFALLYSVGDGSEEDLSSVSSGSTMSRRSCFFEGAIGIPDGHPAIPRQLDLKRSSEGFVPAFRDAMRTREPTILHTRDGTLPEPLLDGIEWRGFGDPCNDAIIFPIRPTNGELVMAFLLVGINPRRPYDDEYRAFTNILNRQLATSLASFMLWQEEVRRSKDAAEAAALEQKELEQQLALQTSRLRRMTELSPQGMFLLDTEGTLREANDRYFEMTGHPRDQLHEMSFLEQIDPRSIPDMEVGWRKLTEQRLPWSGDLLMKKVLVHPVDVEGQDIDYWVFLTAIPDYAPDGSVRSVMGSLIDVSEVKWAQNVQNRRLQEAEETRRQQNEFIDITSHEMRNPLSAILQCADDILSTLQQHQAESNPPSIDAIRSCLEAAHTISICVQHQKSIVDDILTVSKLDSNLLVITPVPAQPVQVVKRALKMFEPELQAKDIKMTCEVQDSFEELKVSWLVFDPSRILQILINLVTNAIKFTAGSPKRAITVSVGVTREAPLFSAIPNFLYIPPRSQNSQVTNGDNWGEGEELFLRFKVHDTGCGLTPEEIKVLFQRFSQASPRTHAVYGGSGLGLFISRQLTELHGGQIGVASEAQAGSVFGFFIQARRTSPPSDGASSGPMDLVLPIERELGGGDSLNQPVAPLRQDLAGSTPGADLVASRAGAPFDPKDLEVLVVEDNLVNQNVLVKQLRKHKMGVSVANDGLEALAFLEGTSFRLGPGNGRRLSVILMDLEMPNMDGLTCVREIRKMQESGAIQSHVPVIAVTANVRDEHIATAKRSGMDDVVSKPFRIPDLLKKIEVLLADLATKEQVASTTTAAAAAIAAASSNVGVQTEKTSQGEDSRGDLSRTHTV
ncbi:aerobic respiration control sensor protein arcB [Microdochium trichocladiopsis]|uniref:histidine kinase n=1 Tax=Microdochium trichocladiopsis TaxID=1682393 RepID=A0A9P9BS63_9PEZI|nr:aerobic respiration control sensor protein arcB [Microdochium trichocladiopsis]KAH7028000.1 aerobic respiration control sensor protein arcB [Microdochium trichocladiopsis]